MRRASKLIESTLSNLVNGNIWPLSKPATEDPDEYIVYNPENEELDYGDDWDQEGDVSFQVHWFKRGQANYFRVRTQIRDALRETGFLIEPSPYIVYEADEGKSANGSATGWTHMVIVCSMEEE